MFPKVSKDSHFIFIFVVRSLLKTFFVQGTLKQLEAITGWQGKQVLYFGDHPYTDLADVTLEHGWRTGAIVHELSV